MMGNNSILDQFYFPKIHGGLSYIDGFKPGYSAKFASKIPYVDLTTPNNQFHKKSRYNMRIQLQQRQFPEAIEFATIPVICDDLEVNDGGYNIGGRNCLFGKVGEFWRKRYLKRNKIGDAVFWERFFEAKDQVSAMSKIVPQVSSLRDCEDLDFIIVSRNHHNFYHFLTETLPQLELASQLKEHRGQIILVAKSDALAAFVPRFVEAFYPHLFARVDYAHCDIKRNRAIIPYQSSFNYFFENADGLPNIEDHTLPIRKLLDEGQMSNMERATVLQNSYESCLFAMHERVNEWLLEEDCSNLPKLFYIGRKISDKRARPMTNSDVLDRALKNLGFETVYLEDYTPIEQAALFKNAQIVVGQHGAGFANMAFSSSKSLFIEIGNFLTVKNRAKDWSQFSFVSACRCLRLICDIPLEEYDNVEKNISNILPSSISLSAINRVERIIRVKLGHDVDVSDADLPVFAGDLVQCGEFNILEQLADRMVTALDEDPALILPLVDLKIEQSHLSEANAILEMGDMMQANPIEISYRQLEIARRLGDKQSANDIMIQIESKQPQLSHIFREAYEFGYCPGMI